MQEPDELQKYLPLSEATYYIMLALTEPLHGYAVMPRIEKLSRGQVSVGTGTIYNALANLEKEGLIRLAEEEDRRKIFQLTPKGKTVLEMQIRRLEMMVKTGAALLKRLA